jgi:preprotein translocase subunit Sec61beta
LQHIRSASCAVRAGLARSSDAPASKHFSLSPFIALAVRAMIGTSLHALRCLIFSIV